MADGALLIIDAQEGPMPQTRFVLKKALELGLKIIVVINKIDKPLADIPATISRTHDLFLELATRDDQLEFPTIFAIGREGKAGKSIDEARNAEGLTALFETILESIPEPKQENGAFHLLATSLDYDTHKGKHIIGKVMGGNIKKNAPAVLMGENNSRINGRIETLMVTRGLKKEEVDEAVCGDIVDITGFDKVTIGDTLADPSVTIAMPRIHVEEPTIKIAMGPNSSPFAGREGKFTTSRQIEERLQKELETNVALKVEKTADRFVLSGRGELHLSVLIETMRREGYESEVSKPEVIIKDVNGVKSEPFEIVMIDVPDEYVGSITSEMGSDCRIRCASSP
jgi:GTP-binding protein